MRPQLPNAPLKEVACEIRFHGQLSLVSTWGNVQERVRDEFPKLYLPGAVNGVSPFLQPVKLASADERESVFLAINSFAFVTAKYSDYASFKTRFLALHNVFFATTGVDRPTRFGLRYANTLPPASFGERAPGVLHPALKLAMRGVDLVERDDLGPECQLVFDRRHGPLTLRTALVGSPEEATQPGPPLSMSQGVRLEFDCFTHEAPGSVGETEDLLDSAHRLIDDAFFGMTTDAYQAYLRGDGGDT